MSVFQIILTPIDPEPLRLQLQHPEAGAVCVFEGVIRNHNEGQAVQGLFYQAYVEMAESEGALIVQNASREFEILNAVAVHRIGELETGDLAVWVGVSAAHRDAAFAACRFIIDEIKHRVPIWKREKYLSGESGWLHPT